MFSELRKQGLTHKRDSCCASYCLHKIYSTKVLGIDFKSAVLILYYQKFSVKEMTLRKITVDNSLNYVPQSEQTQSFSRERDNKTNTIKKVSSS